MSVEPDHAYRDALSPRELLERIRGCDARILAALVDRYRYARQSPSAYGQVPDEYWREGFSRGADFPAASRDLMNECFLGVFEQVLEMTTRWQRGEASTTKRERSCPQSQSLLADEDAGQLYMRLLASVRSMISAWTAWLEHYALIRQKLGELGRALDEALPQFTKLVHHNAAVKSAEAGVPYDDFVRPLIDLALGLAMRWHDVNQVARANAAQARSRMDSGEEAPIDFEEMHPRFLED